MTAFKSVERALAILNCFDEHSPAMGAQEIAARTRMPRPSVYRFLKTLVDNGFLVEMDESEQRRYAIGPRVLALAKLAFGQAELRRCAQPVMQLLAEKSNESVYLSVRQGLQAICIENIDATMPLRYGGRVGYAYPLYAGSPKVILAFLDPALRDYLIGQLTLKSITRTTITSKQELNRRLEQIRRRGFEVSDGEMFPDTRAIGAPVFDAAGNPIAVLSVGAPRGRIGPRNQPQLGQAVMQAAEEVTRRFRRLDQNLGDADAPAVKSTQRSKAWSR